MKEPPEHILNEAVTLINQLRSHTLSEEDIPATVGRLKQILPDPHFMGYTINKVPPLSAEEIVRKAFTYKPIQL